MRPVSLLDMDSTKNISLSVRKNMSRLLLVLLFVFNPFIAMPFVLREIYYRKKYAQILLSIFMGCISMFYYPYGDSYRYMEQLHLFRYLSFDEVFDFNSVMIIRSFNLVNMLMWIGARAGLTLELFRAILVFISFLLMYSVYNDIDGKDNSQNLYRRFIFFLIFTLSIPLYYITYGFRTGFGTCLFAYGLYHLMSSKQKIKGIVFIALAAFTHFYFILFALILAVASSIISGKRVMYILIVASIGQMYIFNILYGKIEFLTRIMDSYIYGDYGNDFTWTHGLLVKLLLRNGFAIMCAYYIFFHINKPSPNTKLLQNILYICFGLLICSISFKTILERTIIITTLLVAVYLIANSHLVKIQHARIWLFLLCIGFTIPFIVARDQYREARLERMTYYSLPQMLLNTYPQEEVNKHVDIDGAFIK